LLASVEQEIRIGEAVLGEDHGFEDGRRVVFPHLRTAEYRASAKDVAQHLLTLMRDAELRRAMGDAGRRRVVERFDYRIVAKQFVTLVQQRLGID